MVTLKDIALEAGVSIATVSYVINNTGSVSKEVRDRVRKVIEKRGYKPYRHAQAMRTGRTHAIGLVLPDLTNPFFPQLAQTIQKNAHDIGCAVILIDSQDHTDMEREGFQLLNQQQVDGVIWCPVTTSEKNTFRPELNCPVVVVDRPIDGYDTVYSNYIAGGKRIAEYVIGLGHTSVGLLSGPQDIASAQERRMGFLQGAQGKLDVQWEVSVAFTMQLPKKAIRALEKNQATMLIAADDVIAIGAINALREIGKRIPEDISVIGFDDIPWANIVSPKLTTVHQRTLQIGKEAVNLLAGKIRHPDEENKSILLDVDIIERESTRPL